MDNARWIIDLLTAPATPLYGIWLTVGVLVWKISIQGIPAIISAVTERLKARNAAKDADWSRLRGEVKSKDDENRLLKLELHECEDDRVHWMHRAIKAEAFTQGEGEVRQAAAVAAAEIRADPEKAPETAKAVERLRHIQNREDEK